MAGKYENISNKRHENVKFFEATMKYNNELPSLKKAIHESLEGTLIFDGKSSYNVKRTWNKEQNNERQGISIQKATTIDAALELEKKLRGSNFPYRIGILNFASATTVGGGVAKGSNAQEESICRVSTLYPVLNSDKVHEGYYLKNRICGNRIYENICVYSPDIIIFRKDGMKDNETLPEVEWTKVDVLTCPAPNLRKDIFNQFNQDDSKNVLDISEDELKKVLSERIKLILYTAAKQKITHLILGAFGCGAFKNPPEIVSNVFYDELVRYWMNFMFMEVVFAIPYTQHSKTNYDVFENTFRKYKAYQEIRKESEKFISNMVEKYGDLELSSF